MLDGIISSRRYRRYRKENFIVQKKNENTHDYDGVPTSVPLEFSACFYLERDVFLLGMNDTVTPGLFRWNVKLQTQERLWDQRISYIDCIGHALLVRSGNEIVYLA